MDFLDYAKNNRLKIIVKPNSKNNEIKGFDKEKQALRVNIKAEPENNKANMQIIKFFKKLTKKEIKITSGLTSKQKTIKWS